MLSSDFTSIFHTKIREAIILRQIAAPNQYLRSICAKNVRHILFESSLLRRGLHEVSSEGKVSAQRVMGRAK
jgi:hypothetical protein